MKLTGGGRHAERDSQRQSRISDLFIFFSRFDWLHMENVREKWIDWYGKRAEI